MLRNARTRLILASILLSSGVAALVLALVYVTTTAIIEAETRSVVEAELAGLEDDFLRLGIPGLARAIERRKANSDQRDAIYLLTAAEGRVIAGNLATWPPDVKPGSGWVELELRRTDSEQTVPVAAASLELRGGVRLLVGRDASAQKRFDRVFVQSAAWALVAALALSVVTGGLLTRLVFSRITEISQTADTIMAGNLEDRIPLRGTGDELDAVAGTLNDMLDRITGLVANLRTTTGSLSHDLRSPLTRLRSNVATLTDPKIDGAERDALAERALAEVDHLLTLFSNLTEIARVEARLAREDFEAVDINSLVADAMELYAPLAEDRGVTLVATGQVETIRGHRALLMQALVNVLENALRYAPEGSEVTLDVRDGQAGVSLSVTDAGPGVPEAFLADAVKPFTTADDSRSDGNTGLGLALVAAVVRLHYGQVRLENRQPGLRVTLHLARS